MFGLFKPKTKKTTYIEEFTYNNSDIKFEYIIIRKSRMKNCYIRIKENKAIVTASNNVSTSYLHDFVDSKANWIANQLSSSNEIPNSNLMDADASVPLLGNWHKIKIQTSDTIKKNILHIEDNLAIFNLKDQPTNQTLKDLRDTLYKELCPIHLTPSIEKYASIMQLHPTKVTFRKTKSRWGSCSSKNTLSLNTRLMMLPPHIADYIIIHELSHIKHKNHSKEFWSLVQTYDPNYKENRKALRAFEKLF